MKMEPTVSSETSAIRTQTPGNYPKRNTLHSYILLYINYTEGRMDKADCLFFFRKSSNAVKHNVGRCGWKAQDVL